MKNSRKGKKMWGYIIDTLHKPIKEKDEKDVEQLHVWEVSNSKIITWINCHDPKPNPRVWQSFHTSSQKTQSINDTNIHLVTRNYQLTNSCSE